MAILVIARQMCAGLFCHGMIYKSIVSNHRVPVIRVGCFERWGCACALYVGRHTS
jgi:hypothetical protein